LEINKENLNKISLEAVLKLRQKRRPKEILDPSKGIPIYILKWISQKFSADSSIVYIYQSTGRLATKINITGNKANWKSLNFELFNNPTYKNNKIILDLYYSGKSQKERKVSFGYFGIERSFQFTTLEIQTLKQIMIFVSDYVFEIFNISRIQFHDRAHKRISAIQNKEILPGTLIKIVQGTISRAIRAYTSFFLIVDNNRLVVEYYQKPKWNRPGFSDSHLKLEVNDTFIQLCQNNDFFHWVDLKQDKSLKNILTKYIKIEDNECEFLIGVSKINSTPIGLWIFQFNKNQLLLNDLARSLILKGNNIAKTSIKYLYQRRTNKMIVEPIFKSRDTRIKEQTVFTLMPFTEKWSDRIWKKLIRPIIISEGLEPIRADDLFGRDIMEDIWSGILQSSFVIADITNRNPNVFYELGIAHTLGKDVILLTQSSEDIPFDLNRYRHIIYEDNYDGYKVLKKNLKATIRDVLRK